MRRCRSFKYVRSRTGGRVRRCASYRRPSGSRPSSRHAGTGRPPPNKGASCVARQRVYSARLGRHVLRCKHYVGGRVGQRKPPSRKPYGPRCTARQRIYSPALRKTVLRCAKMTWPERGGFQPVSSPASPAVSSSPSGASVYIPNITRSSGGRARIRGAIQQIIYGFAVPTESLKYLRREERRMSRGF